MLPPPDLCLTLSLLLGSLLLLPATHSFTSTSLSRSNAVGTNHHHHRRGFYPDSAWKARSHDDEYEESFVQDTINSNPGTDSRRGMLASFAANAGVLLAATTAAATMILRPSPAGAASARDDVGEMLALIREANGQLEKIPPLLKEEKWDGVRSVLMEAPLRDCWSKSTPVLKKYAEALGETPGGDELAALEGREDLLQHLRFLDMAVYNNVFNPIATEGTTGASKALIDSYYNDPTREYEASKRAIEALIELSNGAQ